ncbi:hypothetical protein CsatB_005198 [Cannabis sativa]|uniref:Uncharacterized protein n=2 Tax=Cannabis sativa TaxID=3483 RepID=A0AB40EAH5_CANSA|nr:uncharacterized protein LOC115704947 [Cannabis sativa]KAF4374034.1 hypothetical protein F8388_007940 [Cannabis sativa]KAF4382467.1 hypothetical protein G4B88_011419 [Cannabis sativa]
MSKHHAPPPKPLIKHKSWSPDAHRDEAWLRRKDSYKAGREVNRSKSVSDEDMEDLKACFELGFGFDSPQSDPKLTDTLPALGLYYAVHKQYSKSLSRSSSSSSICSDTEFDNSSTIIDPGDDSEMVKMRLRQWAQIVACGVRQSPSG